MKTKPYMGKIDQHGEEKLAKDPVEKLTGSLPLPPELVDELVENECLFEPQEVD